ncbi:MAG: exosortase family protein XrtM [Gammaproteobacteria bacterium]
MFARSPQMTFVALFAGLYVIMHLAYFQLSNDTLGQLYELAINRPAAMVINAVTDGPQVEVRGNRLESDRAILEIVRGCDGSGVIFILAAAILAFGARLRHKLVGVLLAVGLIYVLNQARVVVLYFVVVHRPEWFTPLHTFYIPTLLIVAACLFFVGWASLAAPHEPATPGPA